MAVDDEDAKVSSDVVHVALADDGVSVDVDSAAIRYNHIVVCPTTSCYAD